MGSFLLMAGAPGKRFALPNSRVMIHQPLISGGLAGQASDIEIHARELIKTKKLLTDLYVVHTGQTYEVLDRAMDRDNYMNAEEAKKFGLVDHIVQGRKVKKENNK
jgi:ATP-dependent Clp protease protease subunit